MQIIDLVDSIEYAKTNCFQQQLTKELSKFPNVKMIALSELKSHPNPEFVVCRLKQRTVHRVIDDLRQWLNNAPITFYDQDPWHSFMDDSEYKGVFKTVVEKLNVRTIAVTSKWWADLMISRGIPSTFVKMGILPELCNKQTPYTNRKIQTGFIGTVHPHRKNLYDSLRNEFNVIVNLQSGFSYKEFLNQLSNIKIFIHAEDSLITVDGEQHSKIDLVIKDIEVASQNCFSIRNRSSEYESYVDDEVKTIYMYDEIAEIPTIIEKIETLDSSFRQSLLDQTNDHIRNSNNWLITAQKLIQYEK